MTDMYKFQLESMKGRYHLEDLGVLGKIILKHILGKWGGGGEEEDTD
jgi:hypothetical protein